MQYETDRLVFRPFVPQAFKGARQLTNFKYRGAVLNIEMTGYGNEIQEITLDGQPLAGAAVPASLTGAHALRIVLRSQAPAVAQVNRVANLFSPETPQVTFANGHLSWPAIAGAQTYRVLKNGQPVNASGALIYAVPTDGYAEYQVLAIDNKGLESFASEPLALAPPTAEVQLETLAPAAAYAYKGFSGAGFVEVSTTKNVRLALPVEVPAAGLYALDFRYANGNGPINTNNKCAIRTLRDGQGRLLGTVVLPQRGVDEWSSWGFSNLILVRLAKGKNQLALTYEPANTNMNGAVNQAMLDYLRLRRIE